MNPRKSPSPRRTKGRKLTNAEGHAAIDAFRRALTAPKETPRRTKITSNVFPSGGSWTVHVWKDGCLYCAESARDKKQANKRRRELVAEARGRSPKKPAPFARLMWADRCEGGIDLHEDEALAQHALDSYEYEGEAASMYPVLVIDARPESLEAMKEAGARAILPSSWPMWQKREMVAALMQSWGLTRGTV